MKTLIKKLIQNNLVVVVMGLPNLGINLGIQFLLDVVFKWSGAFSLLAYLIGLAASIEYSIMFSMLTKSNFRIGKWEFHYSTRRASSDSQPQGS